MILLLVFLSLPAWSADPQASKPLPNPTPAPKAKTLYERLGGRIGVAKIANEFVDVLSKDSRLLSNPKFKEIEQKEDKTRLKKQLTDHMCHLAGGPCKLKGNILKNPPPENLRLSTMEWFYIIQDANTTLNNCNVSGAEKMEIISMLMKAKAKEGK